MQESIVFLLRVQCRRKESSRSLSHLLMSFLSKSLNVTGVGPDLLEGFQQVARLLQRDRTAGCVSYGRKWKNVTERQYFCGPL